MRHNSRAIKVCVYRLKCAVHQFPVYPQGCAAISTVSLWNVFIIPERNPLPISSHSHCVPPQLLAVTSPLPSVWISFILEISYQRNHITCGLLCLASFLASCSQGSSTLEQISVLHSFLLPNSIRRNDNLHYR